MCASDNEQGIIKLWPYSLKAHAYYFTVFINLEIWRAVKLGIFTHFSQTYPDVAQVLNHWYMYTLNRSPAAFNECLIKVIITLLRTTAAQKKLLYYPQHFMYLIWLPYVSYMSCITYMPLPLPLAQLICPCPCSLGAIYALCTLSTLHVLCCWTKENKNNEEQQNLDIFSSKIIN